MNIIRNEATEAALQDNGRVYLCGNLALPNGVDHICTDGYEIGISYYADFSADKPHYHASNTEYNYVLEGEIKILLIRDNKEIHLRKGDLFVLSPNEPYVGKCLPGTRVLFSKVPGGNDKEDLPLTEELQAWCCQWDSTQGGKERAQ